MRYFFDCKCIEDGSTIALIALISLGLVAEDGRKLYAENSGADLSKAGEWVAKNVVSELWSRQIDKDRLQFNPWIRDGVVGGVMRYDEIARKVRDFCNPQIYGTPEFWVFYDPESSRYPFRHLIGWLEGLPPEDPMDFRSIKRLWQDLGNPTLPGYKDLTHHALAQAQRNKQSWQFLQDETARLYKDKAGN